MKDEQMKQIAIAANNVWQDIGDDILEAASGSIPRDDVIEVVIDAGRLREELLSDRDIDQPTIDAWQALPYEERSRLLVEHAFKYERYGY